MPSHLFGICRSLYVAAHKRFPMKLYVTKHNLFGTPSYLVEGDRGYTWEGNACCKWAAKFNAILDWEKQAKKANA
jgi:hypothetical protein